MTQVCARSSVFFGSSTLPPPVLSRAAPRRQCHRVSTQCAQSGELYFVANNSFKVKKEGCQQFEDMWKNRDSNLRNTPGFVRFALLKGDEEGEYISQSTWADREAFKAWTQSQNFAKAHGTTQGVQEKKPEQEKKQEHGKKREGMAAFMDGPPKPRFYEAITVTEM